MDYRINANKSIAFNLVKDTKYKVIPNKKKFNKKKERRKNKIKLWDEQ